MAAVILVAAVAAGGFLVVQTFARTTDAGASADAPASTTAPVSAAPTTDVYSDPRATGTEPVVTEPSEDVATDEPHQAPEGRADVVLSFAEWESSSASVQVNAYVGGLVEDGGTCTLTLTRGADTRTASVAAFADASTTICELLAVPGSQLGSGTWQVVVGYHSGAATGSSGPVEVTVP